MHIEDRGMSGPLTGAKPIFPIPISGQTLMFSASNCHTNLCEQGRGSIHTVPHNPNPSRCSCEGLSSTTGFNRLLLPAGTHTDQCTAQLQANLASTVADSWLQLPAAARNNATYESLLLNGIPLYGKFNNESYPSIDYALLANARRKNATRETTSTLKAWLNEHKKNPYPTKGEKIMLAILTKMTLTQVSTWFANARRRLKKENKMTWSPRKKSGEKKLDGKDDDSDASDSDIECMDVDVDGDPDSPLLEEKETSSTKEMDGVNQLEKTGSEVDAEIQRPSVIRTIDSPTFNEIRDRFSKDGDSPVNDLQKWVNGCFQESSEPSDFPVELTPPSTPIENKITTFTSQNLFEAFDASKNICKSTEASIKEEPSYNSEPLHLIFSSRQPVCSTKVTSESTSPTCPKEVPAGVITPQPSPKNTEFSNLSTENAGSDITSAAPKIDYRVQGLTTSRELEAVLALTNLCKT